MQRHPPWSLDLHQMQSVAAPSCVLPVAGEEEVKKNNGTARCNTCKEAEEEEERKVAENSRAEVQCMQNP